MAEYDLKINNIWGHHGTEGVGGFVIAWHGTRDGNPLGFGEVYVDMRPDGMITLDNEYMSDEFTEALFAALIKQAIKR